MSLEQLTIVIPTYNRIELLRRSLSVLLPLLPKEVRLLILDNCSDKVVSTEVNDLISQHPSAQIDISRNSVNIGGNCNIMRAFECCETRYLWILGDDDIVCDGAFERISEALVKYSNSIYFNFSTQGGWSRTSTFVTEGLSEFVTNGIDDLGQIMFISSSIFDAHKLKPYCATGMHYGYSMLPHIVTLFTSLREHKQLECVLLPEPIVSVNHADIVASQMGSCHTSALGLPSLLTLPWSQNEYLRIAELIASQATAWLSPRAVFLSLLFAAQDEHKRNQVLVIFRIIRKNLYAVEFDAWLRARAFFYSMLLRWPNFSFKVINRIYRFFGKEAPQSNFDML